MPSSASPRGRAAADPPSAVLHVDLDGARHVFAHHGWSWERDDDPLFETGLANLLGFLAQRKRKATLFCIASDLDDPARKALLERAVREGHEIASHSLNHPELDSQGPGWKRNEVFESKRRLEEELGVTVRGFRAPSYQIDRDTLDLLDDAGYAWDSSAYPTEAFARRLGVPAVPPHPARLVRRRGLWELPLPETGRLGVPFHPSYGLVLGQAWFDHGLRRHRETGNPLVFLLHLTDFADPLPSEVLPNWKSRLFTLSHRSASEKRASVGRMLDEIGERYSWTTTEALLERERSRAPRRRLVLGISTTHETGAALLDGETCLAAVSEERLDRVKFSTKYPPKKSIDCVVKTAGVDPHDITDVVVAGLPPGKLWRRFVRTQLQDTLDFHGLVDYLPHNNKLAYRAFAWLRSLGYGRVRKHLESAYGIRPRLHFVPHHLAHAAAAYRSAPFDDALVVTADGVGDYTSVTVSTGRGGRIELQHLVPYPHSFGQFYTACTQLLGFRANRHEGKITGLSGFGRIEPELYELVKSTIKRSGPEFQLDKRYYSEGIVRRFSWKRWRRGEDLFEVFGYRNYKTPLRKLLEGWHREEVAAVFQRVLEEELLALVRPFQDRTGLRNLALCGGVFANVKGNAELFRRLGFDHVYVYPAMGDGGLGAGAAMELEQSGPAPFDSVYLGPEYSDDEIEQALRAAGASGLRFERPDDLEARVARLLADQKVVARFDGRMEFGPRALGNRSILYAASEPEANTWLNKRLGRTEFMPFAPIVMAERADELFEGIAGAEHACKFMTIVVECTERMKESCPAVVHVDGTARPQLVSPEINPGMHRILAEYEKLTGVPVLVNTSFNMHEEPIVCSPEDGVRAYLASQLDYLAIGPYLAWLEAGSRGERTDGDAAQPQAPPRPKLAS